MSQAFRIVFLIYLAFCGQKTLDCCQESTESPCGALTGSIALSNMVEGLRSGRVAVTVGHEVEDSCVVVVVVVVAKTPNPLHPGLALPSPVGLAVKLVNCVGDGALNEGAAEKWAF